MVPYTNCSQLSMFFLVIFFICTLVSFFGGSASLILLYIFVKSLPVGRCFQAGPPLDRKESYLFVAAVDLSLYYVQMILDSLSPSGNGYCCSIKRRQPSTAFSGFSNYTNLFPFFLFLKED